MTEPECSFCGKGQQRNGVRLVAGNGGVGAVYICNECVELCVDVLAGQLGPSTEGE